MITLFLDGLRHTVAVVLVASSPYDSIACFHFSLCAALQLSHLRKGHKSITWFRPPITLYTVICWCGSGNSTEGYAEWYRGGGTEREQVRESGDRICRKELLPSACPSSFDVRTHACRGASRESAACPHDD